MNGQPSFLRTTAVGWASAITLGIILSLQVRADEFDLKTASVADRVSYHRAREAAVWAITVYDLETASYIRNMDKSSIDSNMKDVKKNRDGSVDIFLGPKPPAGKESNWIPTDPKRRFFLLSRFYGPLPALFDGSFVLNNVELVR